MYSKFCLGTPGFVVKGGKRRSGPRSPAIKIGLYKLKSYAGAGGTSWNSEASVLKIGLYKLKSYAGAGGNKLEF